MMIARAVIGRRDKRSSHLPPLELQMYDRPRLNKFAAWRFLRMGRAKRGKRTLALILAPGGPGPLPGRLARAPCPAALKAAGEMPFGHRRHGLAAAAAPGVVLCVADGIVRIVVHVVAGEDLGGRLRRGIDRLIGVAAGERERCGGEDDAEPPVGRLLGRCAGEVGHQVLLLSAAERVSSPESAISLNSAGLAFIRCAARRSEAEGGAGRTGDGPPFKRSLSSAPALSRRVHGAASQSSSRNCSARHWRAPCPKGSVEERSYP